MRLLYCIVLVLLVSINLKTNAQDANSLRRVHKEEIKLLKEQHGLNSIQIEIARNGFWYYLVSKKVNKKKLYGIIDSEGNVLYDCQYIHISFVDGIDKEGYYTYNINNLAGKPNTITLYNYQMPPHFILAKDEYALIASCTGKILSDKIFADVHHLGSWLFYNAERICSDVVSGRLKLLAVNNTHKNMRFATWDGKELFGSDLFLIQITSKEKNNYNNLYAHGRNNKMVGLYLEDKVLIIPTQVSDLGIKE